VESIRRRAARRVLSPRAYASAARTWRAARRRLPWDPSPVARATRTWLRRVGPTVQSGPFAGLSFPRRAVGHGLLLPKLIGTYEDELHSAIEAAVGRDPELVIDIGAAEGYYAVGLARRLPGRPVIAVDTDPEARRLCAHVAEHNGVTDAVEVRAGVGAAEFRTLIDRKRVLAVVDCEGCEGDLITGGDRESLAATELIIEVHDFVRPGTSERLIEHLAGTHRCVRIEVDRSKTPPTRANDVLGAQALLTVQEGRPRTGMSWIHAVPGAGADTP
jgi:hypothetical protein